MFSRAFSVVVMELLFTSMVILALNVRPTMAIGESVCIHADGSITPIGAPIVTYDNTMYTFYGNISYPYYEGIVVQRSNIIIDGKGYTVHGRGSWGEGIDMVGSSNVTIENTNVESFGLGIYLESSSYNNITENNITANNWGGIWIYLSSNNNSISNNRITANTNGDGIQIYSSSNNSIYWNIITANDGGIQIYSASNNSLNGNSMIGNNYYGIGLYNYSSDNRISGNVFTDCGLVVGLGGDHNFVKYNTINGKPLVYLQDVTDGWVFNAGQVILIRCNRISVEYVDLSRATLGLELWQTNSSTISWNTIRTNNYYGVLLLSSFYNTITRNNIANDSLGICLVNSSDNNVWENNVANNGIGIHLEYAVGNRIYHNNFINNTSQVDLFHSSTNAWDDGYPSFGNYWSNHTSPDLYHGPFQNIAGSDGIVDAPHIIDSNNKDNYPLMGCFSSFTYLHPILIVSNSTISNFQFLEDMVSFSVLGLRDTNGFCTITILHSDIPPLLPPYSVKVDGNAISYAAIFENGTMDIIYFTYENSTHEVTIAGGSSGGSHSISYEK